LDRQRARRLEQAGEIWKALLAKEGRHDLGAYVGRF
jgi:hypothetical protein